MKKMENRPLLLMLILMLAVGQMAQTIYVPAMAEMADALNVHDGTLQRVMAAYLMTYGGSQLIYGPLSDSIGRRPVILAGMTIFMIGAVTAMLAPSLNVLVLGSAIQGLGTGVAGVMARTMPRDLYAGVALRQANSLLNMGLLVSPLLAPVIGALLTKLFGWHACFAFLLLLCVAVTGAMMRWLPETRPQGGEVTPFFRRYQRLLRDASFVSFIVLLIGALGLDAFTVSILFILPIPAAFFGAWFAGREARSWHSLMWTGVNSCLLAGALMWIPAWFGMMNIWTLLVPAALFFFGAGMLFPLATSGAMEPYAWLAGSAGALIGGLQNLGSGVVAWASALLPQRDQFSLGMLMFATALVMLLCWLPLSRQPEGQSGTVTG
ncbi:multidrug resistance protein D [Pantoea septica]|uniref:multidrug resistance protein D n=1 Tax=Pantoea septica TaxID=472695 RepID=UPI0023F441D6|nr:multidrug resistance protein D [Pantoea septica]